MPTAEHNCNEITQRIMAAFAEVPWPYGSAVHINTPEEAMAELEDILLRSDEAMKYMLPRIMCVAVTAAKPPLLERLLSRLLEFLDVDFYDPEGTNNPLKQAKLRMFSGYTPAQAKAVWRW